MYKSNEIPSLHCVFLNLKNDCYGTKLLFFPLLNLCSDYAIWKSVKSVPRNSHIMQAKGVTPHKF